MTLNESLLYGKRQSFVFLRYVAMFFYFMTLIASYFVIVNALTQAANLLTSIDDIDVIGIITAITSFKLSGQFGVFIETLRNLSAVVIPLYFVATVTLVLNLDRGRMLKREYNAFSLMYMFMIFLIVLIYLFV